MLSRVLSTAEEWGYIQTNPVRKTKLPRRPSQRQRPVLTPSQIQQLAAALEEPARSLALMLGELLALRWGNIDFDKRELVVEETVYDGHFDTPKTRHSARRIPIGPEAAAILAALQPERASPDTLIFAASTGKPLDRRNLLRRKLQPACRQLSLPVATWHWLRHCHATMLDAVGAPLGTVQAQLGHSTSELTRRVYVHSIPEDQRRAVESVERLLSGPKWTQLVDTNDRARPLIN